MKTMQNVLDQLMGPATVDTLIRTMADELADFAECKRRYENALDALREALGGDTSPSVNDEMEAIQKQTASTLFFSGVLGIQANLAHFIDPISRDFLESEPEVYLREKIARILPDYLQAQAVRDRFYALLSPSQQAIYGDITAYVSYLEAACPKLAHFYGYLLGNALLGRAVPGYYPDMSQTAQYRMALERYLDIHFDRDYRFRAVSPGREEAIHEEA